MNKIAVVTMIKNEEDIVESFVRHVFQFADKLFICDHKSTDRTREILDSLKSEGLNLEITTHNRDEHDQAEVTTNLSYRAFSEGFDLVVPLDTDEFPIYANGDSKDLRHYFQTIDTNQYYQMYSQVYCFTDSNSDKYVFARSMVKTPDPVPNPPKNFIGKVFFGREFIRNHPASVAQGNHALHFFGQSQPPIIDSKIFLAHFATRSPEQKISKFTGTWLNSMLKGSRYTVIASHDQDFAHNYLKDPSIANIDLDGYIPADLSAYKDECVNQFTGGGAANSTRNLYILADSFVNTITRERMLSKKQLVRIFLLFDGDVEKSIQSLDSIFNQTYPFKKIFIVTLTNQNVGELILAMKDRSTQVEFVDQSELQDLLIQPDGFYVQFVLSGDKLHPDKIMHCVEFENSSNPATAVISEIDYPENFNRGFLPRGVYITYDSNLQFNIYPARPIIKNILSQNQSMLSSAISRAFCQQKIFDRAVWIPFWLAMTNSNQFCIESTTSLFLANIAMKAQNICFLNEKLVERGARDWTNIDLVQYQNINGQVLNKL